jgi:hypothetical protein
MGLTSSQWGLRAPITPRLGTGALPRLRKSNKEQTDLNTKLRILPESRTLLPSEATLLTNKSANSD